VADAVALEVSATSGTAARNHRATAPGRDRTPAQKCRQSDVTTTEFYHSSTTRGWRVGSAPSTARRHSKRRRATITSGSGDLGRLRVVAWNLVIFDNGPLDGRAVDTALVPIESDLRRISPDQSSITHDPCPCEDDAFCDEDVYTSGAGVPSCALGTDPVCLQRP
jgi:hypothetical protein